MTVNKSKQVQDLAAGLSKVEAQRSLKIGFIKR
jgi:hypothetical protein